MMEKTALDWIVLVLVIVGAINWGLVAFNVNWNVISALFGYNWFARLLYGLVGLSGLYMIWYINQ